jgi:2-phospho-L-lactate guanylyltransferase
MSATPAAPYRGPRFAVLVPVKPPSFAKSRLRELGDDARRDLATAFAVDTVTAAVGCSLVERVLVVTDDHELARVLVDLGVEVLPDGTSDDLNVTLRLAAAEMHRRQPGLRLVALCADLPALRADELALALTAAPRDGMGFVADADGLGTTAVLADTLDEFRPAFGPSSRQRHLEAGAHEVDVPVPSLRRDVDDRDDLAEAVRLGVGARTALVVTALRLQV